MKSNFKLNTTKRLMLMVCAWLLLLETRYYLLRSAKVLTSKSVIKVFHLYLLEDRWLHIQDSMCSVQNLTCKSQDFRVILQCHILFYYLFFSVYTQDCSWDVFGIPESFTKMETYELSRARLAQQYRSVTWSSSPNL